MSSLDAEERLLIDGTLCAAEGGRSYPNRNPATEEIVGAAADASCGDAERAVAAARRAFDDSGWSQDLAFRQHCLRQLQTALGNTRELLRPQIVAEVGSPLALTYAIQMDSCIQDMSWDIGVADRIEWSRELPEHEFFGMRSLRRVLREPLGVVAAITPWNYPFMLNLSKIVPALVAGNTVVLKAAPDTPWSASWLGRVAAEHTDLPRGVLNILTAEDPATVGDFLTADPRVDMVSFTGSTAVGKRIMARGADTLKRVFLELGGKSAHVVLDDADLAPALQTAIMGICTHAGQGCAINSRVLLPRSRYAEGLEILSEAMRGMSYGDPSDIANLMGPLINARQRDRVLGLIASGRSEGARVLVGGGRPAHLPRGFFVEPTLLADVDPRSTVAQQEIFGPVLCVIPYADDDDAVRIANDSRYGLSGAVSGSPERAWNVAARLRTGTVAVNGGMWFAPDSPFGGYKESGLGREHGMEGFLEYLQTKTVGYPVPAAPTTSPA